METKRNFTKHVSLHLELLLEPLGYHIESQHPPLFKEQTLRLALLCPGFTITLSKKDLQVKLLFEICSPVWQLHLQKCFLPVLSAAKPLSSL